MSGWYHPSLLSGGDRKGLAKELGKARAMANILAAQSAEMRAKGEATIQQADRLLCESWNERMWSDGEPIDPSPTIDQAVNGGFPWLEITCARCKTPSDVNLAAMKHAPTTFVHRLASRLRCCKDRPATIRDSATISLPASPPKNRSLTDVQSLFDHDQPGRHHRAVSRRERIRWQSGADAGGFSRLQGTDRAQRGRGPRTRYGAVGNVVVAACPDGSNQEARGKARSER
jgi:hypothetical protein